MNGRCQVLSNARKFASLLQKWAVTRSVAKTKQLHARIVTLGLVCSSQLGSKLAATYAHCNHASYACRVFDKLSRRTLYSWNVIIRMFVEKGKAHEAPKLFVEMLGSGSCLPDNFTFPFVIKACSELSLIGMGMGIHGQTFIMGFNCDIFVQNSLLAMYMNFREEETAQRVFDEMKERTVVSWNTMISGCFRNGCQLKALLIYNSMKVEGVEPDSATMVSVLPICGYLKDLDMGKKVHELVEEKGFWENIVVRNALVDMYVKCGQVNEACKLVDRMDEKDVITWSTLINGYIFNNDARSALELCRLMQSEGVKPNSVILASLLLACSSLSYLKHGKSLHAWAIRQKLDSEVIMETALIDMYAKCNRINMSARVFGKTSKRKTVPWNALLAGFIHNDLARAAIELFKKMLAEEIKPDCATFNGLLPAYSIIADLQQAANIHGYLIRLGFIHRLEVATVLIDIYSKCGNLECAYKIFDGVAHLEKDIILWSSIVSAYAKHGHGETAVLLFNQMLQMGMRPNEYTFTSVLHACSHAGMVDEGLNLFRYMLEHCKITPHVNHWTCIIDLLGRAGRLDEAYDLIQTMPLAPNRAVWGALLGACTIHEHVELGEIAAKQLFELEPDNTGNYILLTKLHATAGKWREAENTRDMINDIGLRKMPAYSLIGVKNT